MALLWMDSFDHYVSADIPDKYTSVYGATINTTAGRRSSGGMFGGHQSYHVTRTLNTSSSTIIVGFAIWPTALNCNVCEIGEAGGIGHIGIFLNSDGSVTVHRATSLWQDGIGTALGTTAAGLVNISGAFFYFELKVVIADGTGGSITFKINEVAVLTVSSIDTRSGGSGVGTLLGLGGTAVIDDLYVLDNTGSTPHNDFLGDIRVDARYATAEGANSGWTPLSGSDNALMVDETAPDDDTTYNAATVVNLVDTHIVQDAPVVGAPVYGVQVCVSHKKANAGSCSIAPVVRHSGTDNVGTTVASGTSYSYAVQTYGLNPGISAAWTEADFNAAEFGYKRIL